MTAYGSSGEINISRYEWNYSINKYFYMSTIPMKTRNSSSYIINYLCSFEQSISILTYVMSRHLKSMTGWCSKIMQLLNREPLRSLIANLHLIYTCTLYINFHYIYRKFNQKIRGKGHCLEVSPFSKTGKTRGLTAQLSKQKA